MSGAQAEPDRAADLGRFFSVGSLKTALNSTFDNVEGFEAARAAGQDGALVDGLCVEPPAYRNAQRLLGRADRLAAVVAGPGSGRAPG